MAVAACIVPNAFIIGMMVTSDDLVNDLGLSRTAISQIINGKGRYPESTRQRVLARARELGYTPHAGARAARLKRFETLTLFNAAPFWQGIPHPGLYEGCMLGCAEIGYRLLLETVTADGMPGLAQRSNLLGQRNCDGLLMNYHLPPPTDLRRLVDACGVPVLWLNVQLDEACIHPDDHRAAQDLTRALLARGRKRIAYVDTSHDYRTPGGLDGAHYSVAARWNGVREAVAAAGLELRQLTPGPMSSFEARMDAARAFLAMPDRPDAVVCYNELDAQLMLLAATEAGLRPGSDLGIAQFSENPSIMKRPVATAVIPFRDLAITAVRSLVEAVNTGIKRLPNRIVPFTYTLEGTL